MSPWTIEERAAWVRAYLASGMSQEVFCRQHRQDGGPSERTLRTWLAGGEVSRGREAHTALARAARALAVATSEVQRLLCLSEPGQASPAAAGQGSPGFADTFADEDPHTVLTEPPGLAQPALEAAVDGCLRAVEEGHLRMPPSAAADDDTPRAAAGKGFFEDWDQG